MVGVGAEGGGRVTRHSGSLFEATTSVAVETALRATHASNTTHRSTDTPNSTTARPARSFLDAMGAVRNA